MLKCRIYKQKNQDIYLYFHALWGFYNLKWKYILIVFITFYRWFCIFTRRRWCSRTIRSDKGLQHQLTKTRRNVKHRGIKDSVVHQELMSSWLRTCHTVQIFYLTFKWTKYKLFCQKIFIWTIFEDIRVMMCALW